MISYFEVYFDSCLTPYHRWDSNQGSDFVAISLSFISDFLGEHLKM